MAVLIPLTWRGAQRAGWFLWGCVLRDLCSAFVAALRYNLFLFVIQSLSKDRQTKKGFPLLSASLWAGYLFSSFIEAKWAAYKFQPQFNNAITTQYAEAWTLTSRHIGDIFLFIKTFINSSAGQRPGLGNDKIEVWIPTKAESLSKDGQTKKGFSLLSASPSAVNLFSSFIEANCPAYKFYPQFNNAITTQYAKAWSPTSRHIGDIFLFIKTFLNRSAGQRPGVGNYKIELWVPTKAEDF